MVVHIPLVETQNTTVCQNVDSSNLLLFHSKRNEEVCGAFNLMIFSQNMLHLKRDVFRSCVKTYTKMGSQCKLLFKPQASVSSVSAEKRVLKAESLFPISRIFRPFIILMPYSFGFKCGSKWVLLEILH